ncbi:radical SAM protein [Aeromonas veronii]|uniref:radical SAM protein n=1 Tax=Aeromonas veronii TaxID=654 RepID=UPI00111618C6|nr:radical SAM protein [Aeromonas veronii]TNI04354.1 hypothetical protein CF135_15755 [Aeromonas veronii]HDO1312614.1 radical SAM protein [Aeromonas veronii]
MDVLKGLPGYFELNATTKLGRHDIDYLLINVPPICNYDCEKCFTSAVKKEPQNYLKTQEIKDCIDRAYDYGLQCIGILGEGEPLLFIDKMTKDVNYKEIISHASQKGLITILATNASLLTQSVVDFLYRNNVSIAVSLDTLNCTEYSEFYRGSANLQKVLDNLTYARSVYKDDIQVINGVTVKRLCIHMTVTTKNYNNMQYIIDLCGDDIYFDCEHIAQVGIANENPDILREYNSCIEVCRTTKKAMVRSFIRELGHDSCCFFYYGLAISHDGEVLVDTHAMDTKYLIGNVRDYEFKILLQKSKSLRDKFYSKYDCHYCIIRSNKFNDFINDNKLLSR